METSILSRVKQITSPGWMHETSAQGWCTGKTQRDRVEREAGGRSGWGTHVNPRLIHVNVWQKPLQYCKVISLQLIKINGKKKKLEKSQINNLNLHLKQLGKEETKPKFNEIINIRTEINGIDTNKIKIKKINKTKSWFFEKINN